jgi:hypothetical protein
MTLVVERVQAHVAEELDRAGVQLPDAVIAVVADVILAEAVRLSLLWLESG